MNAEGMRLADAIRIVDSHQTWRTWKHDEGGPEMVSPRELTIALNVLLSVSRAELNRQRAAKKPQDDAADWLPSRGLANGIGASMHEIRSTPRIKTK